MSSPFAVFRRHQKALTVILTGLAMFAFIILGAVDLGGSGGPMGGGSGTILIPLLSAAVFAGAFWIWGLQDKKGKQDAMTGALVGLLIGLIPIVMASRQPGIATAAGTITERDLFELRRERSLANQIVAQAFQERENAFPFLLQRYQFGGSSAREVIFKYILNHVADEHGIVVSNERVRDFLDEVSEGKLNREKFQRIRHALQLGETEVFDLLRDELEASLAYQLVSPMNVRVPEQYWRDFERLNVRYTIEASAIPVEPFAAKVERPADDDLRSLFEQFRNRLPAGGEPGFFQPDRVRLAWLKADFEKTEQDVGEISEEDLKARYEERKETFYRIETLPDPDSDNAPADDKAAAGDDASAGDTGDSPAGDSPAGSQPADDKPADGKPDDKTSAGDRTDAAADSDGNPAGDSKPVSGGDAGTDGNAGNKTTTDTPENTAPEGDSPEGTTPENDAPGGDDSGSDSPPAADSSAADSSGDGPAAAGDPAAPARDSNDNGTSDASTDPTAAEGKQGTDGEQESGDDASEDGKPGKVTYRPFEDVRDEIRDILLRERTLALQREKMAAAIEAVRSWRVRYDEVRAEIDTKTSAFRRANPDATDADVDAHVADLRKKLAAAASRIAKLATQYAEENGLEYVETELLSQQELLESDTWEIGSAREPLENISPTSQFTEPDTVATLAFRGATREFFPDEAEGQFDNSRYVYWLTEKVPAHEPTFDEAGIREQVEAAWRVRQAAPQAEERAEKLAEAVTAAIGEKSMPEAIAGQTVTGDEDGDQVSVITSIPFTWLRQSFQGMQMNPFMGPQPTVELGVIPGIDGADGNFMQAVSEMNVGEVRVIPNSDRSVYYVVHLKSRSPAGPDDPQLDVLRQQFLQENAPFSPVYSRLASSESQEITGRWFTAFMEKYGVDIATVDAYE